ncbi:MAG: hypothetical protein ACO3CU_11850 [Candidatus Nanopelagicales bacterium]
MLGVPRQRLARAANSGRLHRVARGHYVVRDDSLAQARHHIDRLQRRGIPAASAPHAFGTFPSSAAPDP